MRASEGHEDYAREEKLEPPSDRKFGLVFTAAFTFIAAWPLLSGRPAGLALAAAFLALALIAPGVLAPLNRAWLRFGLLLNRCVSPFVLAVLFFTTVPPIGLLVRALGKDPLRLRLDKKAPTYWIEQMNLSCDGHWNEKGHQAAFETLRARVSDVFQRAALVPRGPGSRIGGSQPLHTRRTSTRQTVPLPHPQ